jgi:hypothetical protein
MLRFSRGCPYRTTDARQVAGEACRNLVRSRAVIALSGVVQSANGAPYRNRRDGRCFTAGNEAVAFFELPVSISRRPSEENRPIDADSR